MSVDITRVIIYILVASFGGEALTYLIKWLLLSEKPRYSFDLSGAIERPAILIAIMAGGYFYCVIPFIIAARAIFAAGNGTFRKIACLISREEPAIEFQKIRLKSELSLDLLSSPALGILFGLLAKIL